MTNAKHTPGPWIAYSHAPFSIWSGDTQIASCRWTVDDGNGNQVRAKVCEQHQDRAEANARLIAAAPEMKGVIEDGILQFARLTGEDLEHYARTWAVLAKTMLEKKGM